MLDILFRILLYRSMICNLVLSPSYSKSFKVDKTQLCQIDFPSSKNINYVTRKCWISTRDELTTKRRECYPIGVSLPSAQTCTVSPVATLVPRCSRPV